MFTQRYQPPSLTDQLWALRRGMTLEELKILHIYLFWSCPSILPGFSPTSQDCSLMAMQTVKEAVVAHGRTGKNIGRLILCKQCMELTRL